LKEEDQKIKADSIFYFKAKGEVFYERSENQIYSKPTIFKEQIDLLNEIKEVFSKQHTDYKIIISPLYDQKKIAPSDLIELQRIFGKDRVYDFSGINKYTIDFTNFYEPSHYRPIVASQILDSIYSNKK
jgi:hypothetical protein